MIPGDLGDDRKYDICVRRDARFDGVFWFGSRVSGVFCCPSCNAGIPATRSGTGNTFPYKGQRVTLMILCAVP
ncbi:MAG: hypothetical protein IJ026_04255 [Candidatus Methanomethylophilaceae archaeon]|nr:hypothetical protein [Candidatus Methanomethylophilaceae archaeon]